MWDDIIKALLGNKVYIDDCVDRINRKWVVVMCLICLVIIASGQFLRGTQIQCFTPVYFSDEQSEYAESICWTRSTWYLVDDEKSGKELKPEDDGGAGRNMMYYSWQTDQNGYYETGYVGPHTKVSRVRVSYYQWTPIILALQAACFLTPYLIWHVTSSASGLPMTSILKAARQMTKVTPGEGDKTGAQLRQSYCDDLLDRLKKYLEKSHADENFILPSSVTKITKIGRYYGNYTFSSFCTIKIFYIINCIAQIMLLKLFFGNDPRISILQHGIWVLEGLLCDGTWRHSPWFPVETVCHFKAEQQGNPVPYTLECVLPLNLYNDKFFALFTIIFPTLLLLNILRLIHWLFLNSANGRRSFIEEHLVKRLNCGQDDVREFDEFLRRDGVFLLQMMSMNVGGVIVEEVVEQLWQSFAKEKEKCLKGSDETDAVPGGRRLGYAQKTFGKNRPGIYPDIQKESVIP